MDKSSCIAREPLTKLDEHGSASILTTNHFVVVVGMGKVDREEIAGSTPLNGAFLPEYYVSYYDYLHAHVDLAYLFNFPNLALMELDGDQRLAQVRRTAREQRRDLLPPLQMGECGQRAHAGGRGAACTRDRRSKKPGVIRAVERDQGTARRHDVVTGPRHLSYQSSTSRMASCCRAGM
jgi:hypothetical protein